MCNGHDITAPGDLKTGSRVNFIPALYSLKAEFLSKHYYERVYDLHINYTHLAVILLLAVCCKTPHRPAFSLLIPEPQSCK